MVKAEWISVSLQSMQAFPSSTDQIALHVQIYEPKIPMRLNEEGI
jgi:hypothetical protein